METVNIESLNILVLARFLSCYRNLMLVMMHFLNDFLLGLSMIIDAS